MSWALKLLVNSSIDVVFVFYVFSTTFMRSDDSYMNVAIFLSNFSRFSRIVDTSILVVELAFLSDRISYLLSEMPVCIS